MIKNQRFVFLISVILFSCFIYFFSSDCKPIKVSESYMLTFAEKDTRDIRVRYSKDGNTWNDAKSGDVNARGVGVASDKSGVIRMILWKTDADRIKLVTGLGTLFDWSTPYSSTTPIMGPPTAVYAGDSHWLIAYNKPGNEIGVKLFDGERFSDFDFAPGEGTYKDSVYRSPAFVRLGEKIILAWTRRSILQFAIGNITPSFWPNWTNKYTFNPPSVVQNQRYTGITSAPTLTHDHNRFYLGFTRTTSGLSMRREDFFLYSSTDGISWTLESVNYQVKFNSFVQIAGRSDGSVLLASVGEMAGSMDEFAVYRWKGGQWSELNPLTVFGRTPEWLQFALISVGCPESEDED